MKRSEINTIIQHGKEFIEKKGYYLPEFASWDLDRWDEEKNCTESMRKGMLGWDITDYGSGDFYQVGLLLFTVRNGYQGDPLKKPYAEKIMVVEENQVTPMHFHYNKMEDIINRGGGNLLVKVYNSKEDGTLDDAENVTVFSDGKECTVSAGTVLCLKPGESITMHQGLYHSFWGEENTGKVLVGEVSMCNDDDNDNHFLENVGRFPKVEEDETILYPITKDISR